MRNIWILAALAVASPTIAFAQAAEDPPVMDSPPLPWFKYTITADGGATFLSKGCVEDLRRQTDVVVHYCAVSEAQAHRALIEKHDEQERQRREGREKNSPGAKARDAIAALASLEHDISFDHASIARLQQMMANERAAGRISGYVDARNLHDYGVGILLYQRKLSASYADYRARGGRKTPAQIYEAITPHPKPSLFVNLPK